MVPPPLVRSPYDPYRRCHHSCNHDCARGVLVSELLERDGGWPQDVPDEMFVAGARLMPPLWARRVPIEPPRIVLLGTNTGGSGLGA